MRVKRGWRQADLAAAASISRWIVHRIEAGHGDAVPYGALTACAGALDVRLEIVPRWRGGELDRLMSAGHVHLANQVTGRLIQVGGWELTPEATFSIWGERGSIDLLCWHGRCGALLVCEFKTEIADPHRLLSQVDRYRRLAPIVARERGWKPATVSVWVVVAGSSANRVRHAAARALIGSALPDDGRSVAGWLREPDRPLAALSFVRSVRGASTTDITRPVRRVRRATGPGAPRKSRSSAA